MNGIYSNLKEIRSLASTKLKDKEMEASQQNEKVRAYADLKQNIRTKTLLKIHLL